MTLVPLVPRSVPTGGIDKAVRLTLPALVLGLVLQVSGQAAAQTAEADSVRGRDRPEFTPIGIELDRLAGAAGALDRKTVEDKSSPLASFLVFPKMELAAVYESNVFRDSSSEPDKILVAAPTLAVRSDWESHRLELTVGGEVGRHDRHPREDYEDVRAAVAGMAEIGTEFQAHGRAEVARLHQQRGSLVAVGRTGSALEYEQSVVAFGLRYAGARVLVHPELRISAQDYLSRDGINNDDLDRVVAEVKSRFAWEWLPGTSAFVEPSYNDRQYELERDFAGQLQDSHGAQVLFGVTWDVSGVTFIEFGAGWLRQEFDEPSFETVQGPAVSGRLLWNPTDIVTLDVKLGRSVEEKRGVDLTGTLVTSVRTRLDYELFYDTILSLSFDYANEDDRSGSRSDDRFNTAAEARYLIGPNWYAGLVVGYDKLNSNQSAAGFSNTRVALRLGAQL